MIYTTARKLRILTAAAVILILSASCSQLQKSLDVVGAKSITSFEAILSAIPEQIKTDETNTSWLLSAPDEAVSLIWSKDWSNSPIHDVMLEFNAMPFIEAGLDPSKLPEIYTFYENMLMVGVKLGDDVLEYNGEPTPLSSYEQIVNLKRDNIGYHAELDHFGIALGNGNMFEWAKDMDKNDKDIVFVLNPEPFIDAGIDPNAVEGWIFAKVTVEIDGKMVSVDKLLKLFDLN